MRILLTFLFLCSLALTGCSGSPARFAQITPRVVSPPPGKAIINFHWLDNAPGGEGWPLFASDGRLIGMVRDYTMHQDIVSPGEHIYMVRVSVGNHTGAIKVTAEAGRVYDVTGKWARDYGSVWQYIGFSSTPFLAYFKPVLSQGDARNDIAKNEARETVATIYRNDPAVQKKEADFAKCNKKDLNEFLNGSMKDKLEILAADQYRR